MAHLFWVNQIFHDSQDFDNLVEQYKNETNYNFGKNDTRTMKAHCIRFNKNIEDYPNQQYYYRYMQCSRGGKYIPKKKIFAKSRNTKSKKNDCPVTLHATANLKKKILVVRKWISEHNHPPGNTIANDDDGGSSDSHDEDRDRSNGDRGSNVEDSADEFENAHNKKKISTMDCTQAKHKYEPTTKTIANNSNNQLLVPEILKKIKKSVGYDENTVPKKREMLLNLLKNFETLDNHSHSSDKSDKAPALSPSANQSLLHLLLPISPNHPSPHQDLSSLNNYPVHLDLPSSSTESPRRLTSPYRSPSHLQCQNLRKKSEMDFLSVASGSSKQISPKLSSNSQESLTVIEKIKVPKIVSRGRPKRQKRPAIGADYLTYGTKKAKKA